MIITLKNNQELVYAYIVFQVVDKNSKMCPDGEYLFINGFWIHPSYRKEFKEILDYFILNIFIHPETQRIQEVYWERENGKIVRKLVYKFVKRIRYEGVNHGKR